MTRIDSLGFASSSSRNSGAIPHPVVIRAGLAAASEPSSFNEVWEPPTPDEWRRALRILALQAVRQMFDGSVDRRLLQTVEPLVTWR
jgi:hypothetical protein